MAAIFKMAAVKGCQLQFITLNFTELTDLYVFCVKHYVYELKESEFAHICKKIQNGGKNGHHFQNGRLKSCQLQFTTFNVVELINAYVLCVKLYVDELKESEFANIWQENSKWLPLKLNYRLLP